MKLRWLLPSVFLFLITCTVRGDMSTQYNGLPLNTISNLPVSHNISSSTNASPIVITTATPHGMTTGDTVSVNGHQVNTNANGMWPVIVLSAGTFSLTGSSGNGVGGATGTSQSLAAGPTYAIPSDGDPITAASVGVALEALGDRTAFFGQATGYKKIVSVFDTNLNVDTFGTWDTWDPTSGLTNNTWNSLTGATTFVSYTGVQTGDLIELSLDFSVTISQTAGHFCGFALQYGIAPPGGVVSAPAILPGSQRVLMNGQFTQPETKSLHCSGVFTAANSGILQATVVLRPADKASLVTVDGVGAYDLRARIWRQTDMPQ
jgi:hypothetical protein